MPSLLKPYISQEASRGRALNTSRVTPQGVDMSGLVSGVARAGQELQRQGEEKQRAADQLAEVQRREAESLRIDEARMGVERTMSEGAAKWTERMAQAQTEAPKSAAGFTGGLLKEFDTWSNQQAEATQDPNGKKMLAANLMKMRQHLHAEAFKFEVTQRRTALVEDYAQGVNDELSAVLVDPSLWAGAVARKRALVETLDLAPGAREKMARDATERLSAAAATGIINQPGGAEAFLAMTGARSAKGAKGKGGSSGPDAAERVSTNPILSSMTPQALQSSIDRASMLVAQQEAARQAEAIRAQHAAEAAAARRERNAAQGFEVLSRYALEGRKVDETLPSIQMALKAIAGHPYAQAYKDMLASAPQGRAAAMLSVPEQKAQLDALYQRRNTQGTGKELDTEIKRRETVLASIERDTKEDPMAAAVSIGWVDRLPPLQFGQGTDALMAQLPPHIEAAKEVSRKLGRTVSPLSAEVTREVFTRISTMPAPQRAQTLATLAQSMPPEQAQALAAQLDGQSKSDQNRGFAAALQAGADRTTQGRYTSEVILKGMQALQDKTIKEEKTPVDGWSGRIAKITGDVYRNPREAEFIAAKARFILAGKVAEGASGSERDVSEAVTLAAGGYIREHNGQRIPLPTGMDSLSTFRDRLKATKPEALGLPDGKVYVNGQAMDAAAFLSALPDAKLTYWTRGKYFVQAGGSFAAKADGNPVVIEVAP